MVPTHPCMLDFMARLLFILAMVATATAFAQDDAFETAFQNGTDALRSGRLDDAAASFEKCTQLNPSFAEAYLNLGLVRLQQGRFENASTALSKAVELKPRLRGAHLF